ncbi:MAG: SMC family ATPase [Cyanobacteria bacterium J06621_11]
MQILSVALTNFKTHKEQQFHFQPGTNAICGENGAGKTSILEAIAWVLFNYQGSYKKEDLIRNGASSAQARVAFISSKDSRTYEAQRSTTHGYSIYDPQLAAKLPITRTKDEVLPWLRQHLGVAPGTDLGQLFANTIGVPQGTFTADFLLSTEKRKPIFDTILKVEEYRETYRQSNSLRKYAEAQVERLKDLIEQYEESLQQWDELQNRHQQLQLEIAQGESQLARLDAQSKTLDEQRQTLRKQAEQVQQMQVEQRSLSNQIETQKQVVASVAQTLAQSNQAQKICEAQCVAHEQFLTAENQLKSLSETQQQRQQVLQQHQQIQQSLSQSERELSRIEARLEQFKTATSEVEGLAASVTTQIQLEAERTSLQQQTQTFASVSLQQQTLTQQLQQTEKDRDKADTEIARLVGLQSAIETIPEWEKQQTRLQEQLSRVAAAKQFEQELKVLSETGQAKQDSYRDQVVSALKLLDSWVGKFETLEKSATEPIKTALFEGGILSKETLTMINGILNDLSEQTDSNQLQQQKRVLQANLQQAYARRAEVAGLEVKKKATQDLKAHREKLVQQLSEIEKQLSGAEAVMQTLKQVEAQLKRLDNPRAKQQVLEKTLQQKESVEKQYKSLSATRMAGVKQLESVSQQLKEFEQLDTQFQTQQQLKQTHQSGYLRYVQNQQAASQAEKLATDHAAAVADLTEIQAKKDHVDQQLLTLTTDFDPKSLALVDQQFSDINSQADRLRGSLPQLQQRFTDLESQIDGLKAIFQKRDQAQAELKQRERIKRFVNYARKVYKTAGPRITERYVQNVSKEADRLFRELLGRANVALTWSADYEITVQEGAHIRRFINLSGGEQMCAALAVRLALLKVLADIDVAFFDEPTTNMDRPRRQGLAEAIARIKSFQQLFVISHDDTFEQVTETVITVEREQ